MNFKNNSQRKAVMAKLRFTPGARVMLKSPHKKSFAPAGFTNPVTTLPREIHGFVKLSEIKWGVYYQNKRTNEGVDIHYNFDMKEYHVQNVKNGMSTKMIYAGKNQLDAIIKAKNYMINNARSY